MYTLRPTVCTPPRASPPPRRVHRESLRVQHSAPHRIYLELHRLHATARCGHSAPHYVHLLLTLCAPFSTSCTSRSPQLFTHEPYNVHHIPLDVHPFAQPHPVYFWYPAVHIPGPTLFYPS